MLTEIEWWGGLLFIWLAAVYLFVYREFKGVSKFDIGLLSMNSAFLSAAVVLALYFYALDTSLMQYLYIGFTGLGFLSAILVFFDVGESESDEDEEVSDSDEDEDEEVSKAEEILGQAIIFLPIIISLGLACYKLL